VPTFTPHLMPMNRGIYATIYVRGRGGKTAQDLHALLSGEYAREQFIHILPFGKVPQSRHVRGSNLTFIGVVADRQPGRTVICSTLDNLTKGASGQAVQNANLLLGFPESTGIDQVPMFP
jgi:N-acetyl-gamma-glutamyl-phosphate reductase